jgi:peroxiredoxin
MKLLICLTTIVAVCGTLQSQEPARKKRRGRPGEITAPAARSERRPPTLKVGDEAPDFTLETIDGKAKITLSSFHGKRPVVLVFGSITCPPFRREVLQVDALYEKYRDKAEFVMVYIREAHPDSIVFAKEDGSTEEKLTKFEQTSDPLARTEHAKTCTNTLHLSFPVVVDTTDNATNAAYSGWPIRLAVVDLEGKIAYYGEQGPKGFHPDELKIWLEEHAK